MQLKAQGAIQPDDRQEVCMKMLDDLAKRLQSYSPAMTKAAKPKAKAAASQSGGFFGSIFGGGAPKAKAKPKAAPAPLLKPKTGQLGLYLWGGTGTGKTFMMDMFYDKAPIQKKKRIHFHEWMIDVHDRLHKKQKGSSSRTDQSADDLVEQVATDMVKEAWLLCFDEFQVTHISDAIILKRIFSVMWELGAVVVTTSNRPPEDLYLNGLNRPLFLPFIPLMNDFCHVHAIGAEVDYRMISTQEGEDDRVYIHPNTLEEKKILEYKFAKICGGHVIKSAEIETQGRRIHVPRVARNSNVAWFDFKDLCDKPMGSADYLAIGHAFHTIFIANIPAMTLQERDQVRRFITCIDALYECHTKVLCTADLDPIKLFYVSDADRQTSVADEIFAWDRTVSRLMEMQSMKYLTDVSQNLDAEQFLGQFNLRQVSNEDMVQLWRRYDKEGADEINMTELRFLLEDITEIKKGHRNVSDEVFNACVEIIDLNKDGRISFEEFETYLSDYATVKSTVGWTSTTQP